MAFDNYSHCILTISAVSVGSQSPPVCALPYEYAVCHQIANNSFIYYCFHSCSLHHDLLIPCTVLFPYSTCNLSLTDCPSSPFPHEQTANGAQIGPFSLYPGAGDPRRPHFLEGKPLIYTRLCHVRLTSPITRVAHTLLLLSALASRKDAGISPQTRLCLLLLYRG